MLSAYLILLFTFLCDTVTQDILTTRIRPLTATLLHGSVSLINGTSETGFCKTAHFLGHTIRRGGHGALGCWGCGFETCSTLFLFCYISCS